MFNIDTAIHVSFGLIVAGTIYATTSLVLTLSAAMHVFST